MSDSADSHIVDLADEFSGGELNTLVEWGASYLASDNEDVTIRAASLALEFALLAYRNARSQGRKLHHWQQRLIALALVAQCVRARKLLTGDDQVRH